MKWALQFLLCASALAVTAEAATAQQAGPPRPDPTLAPLITRGETLLKAALWKSPDVARIDPGLVVSGDVLVCVPEGERRKIVGLDLANGKKKWESAVRVSESQFRLTAGGNAFVVAYLSSIRGSGRLGVLRASDGAEFWSLDLPAARSALQVGRDQVYVAINIPDRPPPAMGMDTAPLKGSPNGPPELRAYDLATGKLAWKYDVPAPGQLNGLSLLDDLVSLEIEKSPEVPRGFKDAHPAEVAWVYLNVSDGKERADFRGNAANGDIIQAIGGGLVLSLPDRAQGSTYRKSERIVMTARARDTGQKVWTTPLLFNKAARSEMNIELLGPPSDGVLYGEMRAYPEGTTVRRAAESGLTAIDIKAGRQLWFSPSPAIAGKGISNVVAGIPAVSKELLVQNFWFGNGDGFGGLRAVDRADGKPLWIIQTAQWCDSPVIHDGVLYFGTKYISIPSDAPKSSLPVGLYAVRLAGK